MGALFLKQGSTGTIGRMLRRLVTIGASHYCEKARWALERARLPFREERHPPVFHVFVAKRLAGGRSTPVLVTPSGTFPDSTDILKYVDGECAADLRLYPDDPELRHRVEQLEDLVDAAVGECERFYPALQMVVWGGRSVDEALSAALMETVGEA